MDVEKFNKTMKSLEEGFDKIEKTAVDYKEYVEIYFSNVKDEEQETKETDIYDVKDFLDNCTEDDLMEIQDVLNDLQDQEDGLEAPGEDETAL